MISILFLSAVLAPADNLPGPFFPHTHVEGAAFKLEGGSPTVDQLHAMLVAEDDEWNLVEYDETTGLGFLQVIDWNPPLPGTVVNLQPLSKAA